MSSLETSTSGASSSSSSSAPAMQTTSKAPLLAGAGAGGAAPAGTGTSTAPPEPPKSKFKPLPPPPKSKLLRFMGINPAAMKDFIPSRKTSMYFTLIASPFLLYMYDRRCAERIMDEYKARVSHLAERPLPEPLEGGGGGARGAGSPDAALEFPRKVWIMSSRVPDDFEEDRGNRWFKTYIKPVLYAAGYDYSFLNGTAPGALGRRVSERIRLERIANMASTTSTDTLINPGEPGYLESLDKRRHARAMGLTVIVGRNTLKEYLWGLKQGWLVDFDAVKEEKGDEGRTQELKEELMKDGRFDQDVRPPGLIDVEGAAESGEEEEESQGSTPSSSSTSSSTASPGSALFPPRSSYSLFSAPASAYSSTTASSTSPEHEGPGAEAATEKSLIVPAASEIPAQPPLLILPYDHPLGFLRLWPIKMIKWAFMERYRVRQGCETALAIIQATHPAPFTDSSSASSSSASSFAPEHSATSSIQHPSFTSDSDDLSRGIRYIQPPKRPEAVNAQQEERSITIEDIVTENQKKLKPEWRGDEIPETGSKDLDCGDWTEYHYRKSFNDTPTNMISARKAYYTELPGRLSIARELARRDRLPTKEEQKYPPLTEEELVGERLAKEKKWRNDFQGWFMTKKGSKVTWDEKFGSLKVLDLDIATKLTANIRAPPTPPAPSVADPSTAAA